MDFNAKTKENLYDLTNGYYLSKSDPQFWRKLLNRRPENEEAMYHVGLGLEIDAKHHLGKYYTTKLDQHLMVYRNIIKQAFDLIKQSFNRGYFPARLDVLRMEREIKTTEQNISTATITNNSVFGKRDFILFSLLLIAIILSIIMALYFTTYKVSNTNTTNYLNNHYIYMLPYEVIEKKPTSIPDSKNYQPKIITVKRSSTKPVLVNELVSNLKTEYERGPKTSIQVLAIDEFKEEIGMALWAGGNTNIQVYIYPLESTAFIDEQERQLWETTTVVRSAVYHFVQKNGYLPKELKTLNQPFPNNYLTEFPRDPYKFKNNVAASLNGDGGWLFSLSEIPANNELVSTIKDVIKPNLLYPKDIPFEPMYIAINKENHSLAVMSGDQVIRMYSVALGKEDSTPEGELFISKKVMNPDKIVPELENVYGTRALELSNRNYAIHGTNSPTSIGKAVSQGCIRLNNADMEDLYAITPLNTPVKISRNFSDIKDFNNPDLHGKELYDHSDNSKEEDNANMYYWNH
ncbi:L,D-transpeptidase [Desulfosporosinus fructosivorans]